MKSQTAQIRRSWGSRSSVLRSGVLRSGDCSAFTLVELLVVIGIIGVLISILLPSLNKAQNYARQVQCSSNMRSVGQSMLIYANQFNGYLFPPNKGWPGAGQYPPIIDGYNPTQYDVWTFYVLRQWDHPVIICPSDLDLNESRHSYIVNAHLLDHSMKSASDASNAGAPDIKYSSVLPAGYDPTNVVVMGEKISNAYDYYMENTDFDTKVEQYRHGPLLGSNYLMLDMHVEIQLPAAVKGTLDPWALKATTTQP